MKLCIAIILAAYALSMMGCGGGTPEDYAAEEAAAVADAASAPGVSTMPVDCVKNPEVCK